MSNIQSDITEVEKQLTIAYKCEPLNNGEIEELEHQLEFLYNQMDESSLTIYK